MLRVWAVANWKFFEETLEVSPPKDPSNLKDMFFSNLCFCLKKKMNECATTGIFIINTPHYVEIPVFLKHYFYLFRFSCLDFRFKNSIFENPKNENRNHFNTSLRLSQIWQINLLYTPKHQLYHIDLNQIMNVSDFRVVFHWTKKKKLHILFFKMICCCLPIRFILVIYRWSSTQFCSGCLWSSWHTIRCSSVCFCFFGFFFFFLFLVLLHWFNWKL